MKHTHVYTTNAVRPARHDRGFTLIEVLVVLGIIAGLAALAFPVFAQVRAKAKVDATRALVAAAATAIAGKPLTAEGLDASRRMFTFPLWDVNRDGLLDGRLTVNAAAPGADDVVRVAPVLNRFATDQDLEAALAKAGYGGFLAATGFEAPKGRVDAQGHLTDLWNRPLRYAYAPQQRDATTGQFVLVAGQRVADTSFMTAAHAGLGFAGSFGAQRYAVWSAGPDGLDGTSDDLATYP